MPRKLQQSVNNSISNSAKNTSKNSNSGKSLGVNADALTSPIAQATSELEKRIEKTFLFNVHSDPRPMWELTAQLEQELNQYAFITSENTRVILKSSVFLS